MGNVLPSLGCVCVPQFVACGGHATCITSCVEDLSDINNTYPATTTTYTNPPTITKFRRAIALLHPDSPAFCISPSYPHTVRHKPQNPLPPPICRKLSLQHRFQRTKVLFPCFRAPGVTTLPSQHLNTHRHLHFRRHGYARAGTARHQSGEEGPRQAQRDPQSTGAPKDRSHDLSPESGSYTAL